MLKLLLSLLALLFLASCSEGNGEKIAVEDFEFSDWNDFLQIEEAVPLEENEECVLSVASKCLVGKEKLFFWDYKQKLIFSFGRDGRYLGLVGDCGHASNEYSNIKDIQFSPDSTIVQVLDNKGIIYYRADDNSFIKCEKPKFDRFDEAEKFIQISDDEYLFFNPKSGECLIKYANGEATVLRTANTIQMSCEKFYRYGGETKNLSDYGDFYLETYKEGNLERMLDLDLGAYALPVEQKPRNHEQFQKCDCDPSYFKAITSGCETDDWIYLSVGGYKNQNYNVFINKKDKRVVAGSNKGLYLCIFGSDKDCFYGILYPEFIEKGSFMEDVANRYNVRNSNNPVLIKIRLNEKTVMP